MEETIGTGKNIEEAIENGLRSLGAERDEVEVEPLDTGRRGFLGLFGRRNARVRVLIRQDDRIRVRVLMRNILRHLGVETTPDVQEDDGEILVSLGNEASVLVGQHGQTLDSLQYLASRIINNDREKWKKIVIDVNNYRDKREENLHSLSEQLANQAIAEANRLPYALACYSYTRSIATAKYMRSTRMLTSSNFMSSDAISAKKLAM